MSGLLERFKDLVGIVDDAGDIQQRLDRHLRKTAKVAKRIADEGKDFVRRLEATRDAKDVKEVQEFISEIEGRAPFLLKNASRLAKDFEAAFADIDELEEIVGQRFPPNERTKTISKLREARKTLEQTFRLNERAIRAYDNVQRMFNDHLRNWRATFGATSVAGLLLTGGLANVASGIIKGAQEGRILTNAVVGTFSPVLGLVGGLQFVFQTVGRVAAAGVRGGWRVLSAAAKKLGYVFGFRGNPTTEQEMLKSAIVRD